MIRVLSGSNANYVAILRALGDSKPAQLLLISEMIGPADNLNSDDINHVDDNLSGKGQILARRKEKAARKCIVYDNACIEAKQNAGSRIGVSSAQGKN